MESENCTHGERWRAHRLLLSVAAAAVLAACGGGMERGSGIGAVPVAVPAAGPATLPATVPVTVPAAGPAAESVAGVPAAPAPALSSAQKLADLERSGAIPTLDRSDSLAGTDADRNGVRDDIDAYLQRTYPDPAQRSAALQLARGLQASVVLNSPDRELNRVVGRQISRGTHCVFDRFNSPAGRNSDRVGRELEAMTANTKARLTAYLQHNKALDGTSWALPTENTCD